MILKVKYVLLTRILLFLRNILQKSSKNNETIARFSLLCSHWKFSLLNLRNLRRIIATCCDKFSLHSKKLVVGQNWHDPKWLYSDWEYLRSNWDFAVGFEHSLLTNIWPNDVWNIPGLMKWIQTKWLFQNICSQVDLTQTKVPYQTYLRDCVFHLKWLQARPLPTCFDTVLMVQNA